MGYKKRRSAEAAGVWTFAERQHWVITRGQLIGLGVHSQAIKHRVATGRLHPVASGVYAVGRPQLTRKGHWMAAVLSCGPGAVISHGSAAALWEIGRERRGLVEVSVRSRPPRRRPGVIAHRRAALRDDEVTTQDGIPITSPIRTVVDVATRLGPRGVEAAINEADKRGLTEPDAVRARIPEMAGQRGVAIVRAVVDRHTFVLTDSELERRFLPLVRRAGLPPPLTQQTVNGFRVDFLWPELGLVVETDGLRYHRTAAQQAADRVRDQAHAAAGLTTLRFTHAQVRYEPEHVIRTLGAVARRLGAAE